MPASLKQHLHHAGNLLKASSDSPELDARILLQYCLQRNQAWLIAHADETLPLPQEQRYLDQIERRAGGEPVAYITGRKEFWSLMLKVCDTVLIPRPETEILVERALLRIPEQAPWRIADLGTGSGAVGLAIAKERPHCRVTATDNSISALEVAAGNAGRLGIHNVEFCGGDWLDAMVGRTFEMIVSNPPYIANEHPCLADGGLAHEPRPSLQAGAGGLDALTAIGAQAGNRLRRHGWLLLEHGYDQQHALERLLREHGFDLIACHKDHAGQPRVTECRQPA